MSVTLLSSKMEEKTKKKISTLWRVLPMLSEKYVLPNSQYFTHVPTGHDFSETGPFIFIVQVDWFWFLIHMTNSVSPFSIPVTASLPPLEWPLSHQSGSYELRIEVQPKPHHRAHYETEGSRGAVKAPTGGHPVVQVWTWILFLFVSFICHEVSYFCSSTACCLLGCGMCLRLLLVWRMGKSEVELVSEASPVTQRPEKKVFLSWIRIEMIFLLKLLLPFSFWLKNC